MRGVPMARHGRPRGPEEAYGLQEVFLTTPRPVFDPTNIQQCKACETTTIKTSRETSSLTPHFHQQMPGPSADTRLLGINAPTASGRASRSEGPPHTGRSDPTFADRSTLW